MRFNMANRLSRRSRGASVFFRRARNYPQRFLGKWKYRGHKISKSKQGVLMSSLEKEMKSPEFFESLPVVDGHERVRLCYFNNVPFIIKKTEGRKTSHGENYERINRAVLKHDEFASSGVINADRYDLITPEVFGKLPGVVVMEYMEGQSLIKYEANNPRKKASFHKAWQQLIENFREMEYRTMAMDLDLPQISHFRVLGNTNPKNTEKGTWLFSVSYDVG